MPQNPFLQRKKSILDAINQGKDNSPKGSIDLPIVELVNYINSLPNFVTTSSCSGRVALYAGNNESGKWLYVSHDLDDLPKDNLEDWIIKTFQISQFSKGTGSLHGSLVYFKFEPFVMHIEADTLDSARELHQVANSCGYRNSGLSISATRNMVAIRSSLKIDSPVGILNDDGLFISFVDMEVFKILIKLSEDKFVENNRRISQLEAAVKKRFQ